MDTAPSGTVPSGTAQVAGDALDAQAPPEPEELALGAEFPRVDARVAWLALVDQVVRKAGRIPQDAPSGAGFEKLTWRTLDGIPVRPLYTADDAPAPETAGVPGAAPYLRGGRSNGPAPDGWDVRQRHADPDPAAARTAVLSDLENGVSSIWLAVGTGGTAVADLGTVLDGVHIDLAPIVLDASGDTADTELGAAGAFLELAMDRGGDLLGTLGLDPIGRRARTGDGPDLDVVVPTAVTLASGFPQVRVVVVDALPVHGAGASDAQELGFSLAAGVAYLRALTDTGLDLTTAAGQLEFRYAATAEQFPTIAKLRAARLLWSRVTEACGRALPQFQHAVGSPAMLTRRDVHGNLLRGTVAGLAAGVGGADAVTVAPFDAALGASEAFSRRIARNTQSLLVQEAHLARVIDPAGGSWFVESLTRDLARAAWAFFQEIEAAGGVLAALDAGLVAERVAAVRERREEVAARRTAPIIGVSEYADLVEPALERRPVPEPPGGGLPRFRPAAPYEAFRDRSDALLAETGARPRAFLATLGPLAAYTARAGFARNLLQAGGIETPEAGPTESIEDVVEAFRQAGTPVAVLCSTDALYAERASDTVAALRAAGARHVLLAGTADVPGVDGHLAAGCDAPAVIESVYRALEAER
jgi:methylmalonyl-CoA mutase